MMRRQIGPVSILEPQGTTPYHPRIECDTSTAWAEARRMLGRDAHLQGDAVKIVGLVIQHRGLASFRPLGRGLTWNEALENARAQLAAAQAAADASLRASYADKEARLREFLSRSWEESLRKTQARLAEVHGQRRLGRTG